MLLTREQAAERVGRTPRTIARWASIGWIHAAAKEPVRGAGGRRHLYREDDILAAADRPRERPTVTITTLLAEIDAYRRAAQLGIGPTCEDVCVRECIGVCGASQTDPQLERTKTSDLRP